MSETSITYHLPMSVVRISGTRTTTHDGCATQQPAPTTEASTSLLVVADPNATSQVQLHQGWFRQTQATLALTDDGRLSSASSDSQGEVGTLVKAVVSTAATVAGAFAAGRSLFKSEVPEEPIDRAHTIYRTTHAVEAELLGTYTRAVVALETGLASHLEAMSNGVPTREELAELHRIEVALGHARAQLERLETHYKVWRAAQRVAVVEKHQYDVPLDEAAQVTVTFDGRVNVPDSARESRKAWECLGVVVEVRSEPTSGTPTRPTGLPPFRGVHLRQPRSVQIKTWRRSDADPTRAELVSVERKLVVDAASPRAWFTFNTSIWAKRKTATTVGATGGLSTYEYSGDSVGAAIAKTLADVPGGVADGLEQAAVLHTDAMALRTAGTQDALARTKAQLDQLQAQLSLDGLAATEDGYAELARLKQHKQLLEAGNGINAAVIELPSQAAAAELAALHHEVELLKLSHELDALRSRG
jgi:hypothetical protein